MFIKLAENIQKTQPLKRVYKGKVVDNVDPKKLQRLKIEIKGIFEGDPAKLPFVFPRNEFFLGGSSTSGRVSVPEINSELEVRFPFEDIYSPFYYGYWTNTNTKISDFDVDYPNSYGYVDSTGTKFITNKTQKTLKFTHTSGIIVDMDQAGKLTLTIPDEFLSNVTKDIKLITLAKALIDSAVEVHAKAPLIKLGDSPTFHATIAENMIAGHDSHIHPPHPPLVGGPILPPVVLLSNKAGTSLDVTALKILIQGNT